jgi:peptidyl-tRNA hydrolase
MKTKTKKVVAVGIGAVAVAGALAYLFTGKRGEKNKAIVKKWVEMAKKEILAKVKKAKNLTQEGYAELIDKALSKYEGLKEVTPAELKELKQELKAHWAVISKQVVAKKKEAKKD